MEVLMTSLQLAYATERELERQHRVQEKEIERHNRAQELAQNISNMNSAVQNMNNAVYNAQQNYNAQNQVAVQYANYYAKRDEIEQKYGLERQKLILETGLQAMHLGNEASSIANEKDYRSHLISIQEEQNRIQEQYNQAMERYRQADINLGYAKLHQDKVNQSNSMYWKGVELDQNQLRLDLAQGELLLKQQQQSEILEGMKRSNYGKRVDNFRNTIQAIFNPFGLDFSKMTSSFMNVALPMVVGGF